MKTLNKKLAEIQRNLKAPKGQRNNFGNYNYRSAEDILEAVKPLLGDLTVTVDEELVVLGERYYVKSTAELSDGENTISKSAFARESETKKGMDDSQITGSTGSYAKKYALNNLFAIDDTKDSDATNQHGKTDNSDKVVKKPVAKPVETPEPVENPVEKPAENTRRRARR
jgi:hypothetical protein